MASTEILKLLAAGSVNLSGAGGGSHDRLTGADVAAMLAGLSRPATLAGYAKFVGDEKALIDLASHVYCWSAGLANREGWKIVRGQPVVRNMSHLAVAEWCFPNRCLSCGGRGFSGVRVCSSCRGAGFRTIRDAERARVIGMDRRRFSHPWRSRYEQIYAYLWELEGQLSFALRSTSSLCVNV